MHAAPQAGCSDVLPYHCHTAGIPLPHRWHTTLTAAPAASCPYCRLPSVKRGDAEEDGSDEEAAMNDAVAAPEMFQVAPGEHYGDLPDSGGKNPTGKVRARCCSAWCCSVCGCASLAYLLGLPGCLSSW